MKPLINLDKFLKRFNSFKNGEVRSIEVLSATQIKITLAGQDQARDFDWITIQLECTGVTDARLLQSTKLTYLDMNEGISIIKINNILAFGVGECYNEANIKTSTCFIKCTNIKYEEGLF